MSKIVSVGTAVPRFRYDQERVLNFMQTVYNISDSESRKLKYLYHQSGINTRYFAVGDGSSGDRSFYPDKSSEAFPSLECRMKLYEKESLPLSVSAIENCIKDKLDKDQVTHLITVSCTGMSAPGLDLQIMETMGLADNIFRTSLNFMGCYAAIHALKLADSLCKSDKDAKIIIVCTELCSLHFQKEATPDNLASSMLFADGSAAVLVTGDADPLHGLHIKSFYSKVAFKGKKDMSWQLSSNGFLMTLSAYIPDLLNEDFNDFTSAALEESGIHKDEITHWCIHPGGKRILTLLQRSLHKSENDLRHAHNILHEYGNMSSPTVLFVLKEIMDEIAAEDKQVRAPGKQPAVFGAAFGPGLTMESFLLSYD